MEPGDGAVLQIIYAGSARRDPKLEGAVEGQQDGVVIEQYNLSRIQTRIEGSISIRSLLGPLLALSAGILLIFIAVRIVKKTDAGKKWVQERAAAAKHLAELQKRPVPTTRLVSALYVGAFVCILAFILLLFRAERFGPPFGW